MKNPTKHEQTKRILPELEALGAGPGFHADGVYETLKKMGIAHGEYESALDKVEKHLWADFGTDPLKAFQNFIDLIENYQTMLEEKFPETPDCDYLSASVLDVSTMRELYIGVNPLKHVHSVPCYENSVLTDVPNDYGLAIQEYQTV